MKIKKTASLSLLCILCVAGAFAADAPSAQPATKAPVEQVQTPAPAEPTHVPSPMEQQPEPLPSSHEMTSSYESAFVKMFATLLGLVILILATFWVLRRMGRGRFNFGSSKTITIIERKPLSPKSMLYLVECDGKRILISESQFEVRALATLEETLPDQE